MPNSRPHPNALAYRKTVRDLVNAYCDGSTQALLVNLLRNEKLSDRELLELKRLADADGHSTRKSTGKQS